jgi:methyl-accepting chemotaxis protein
VTVGETTWGLLAEMDQSEAFAAVSAMKWMMGITAAVGVAAIVTVALMVANSISLPINRIIEGLTAGAQQTAEAAGQVSGASQSLAEGASEQAAGIEETTSSVEEMTSMTKSNAENASQADGLMEQAGKVVAGGLDSMTRLNDAVGRIRKSSEETAKIIKTIDEIAFQTNLLALNAAVEAARAGEAGKGFAVVAEEVRSLAQRAAEAARTTADLIEESVRNAEDGVSVAGESAKAFEEISESSSKVSQLVSEIASASQQQAEGIEQINQAVTQMDQVTQTNAANAEESASAAEELSSQAEELQHMVNQLEALVSGATSESTSAGATGFRAHQPGASRGPTGPTTRPRPTASAPQHRPQPTQATQPAGHDARDDGDDGMTQF